MATGRSPFGWSPRFLNLLKEFLSMQPMQPPDDKKHAATTTTTTTDDPKERLRQSDTKPYSWPRYVFKRGTGRLVDEKNHRYEAETRLVHDEDELRRLGDGWLNTPREATMGPNVTNANANVTFNEDGTVAVEPRHSPEALVDRNADLHRRTMIDAEETPKPHLESKGTKEKK